MTCAWVFDLDGVIWRGAVPIPGSLETVRRLRERGDRVLFASNNSSMTIGAYQDKFSLLGAEVAADDVVTSAQAAARLVEPGQRVLIVGGNGIAEAVSARGATALWAKDDGIEAGDADVVMVGLDVEFEYRRFRNAVRAVLAGASLIATNQDPTYPAADGMNPGGGSIAMAISYASGQAPVFAGKPDRPMAELITERLAGVQASAMVGDQPLTDGGLAVVLGIPFWLVLTGVALSADGVSPQPERCEPNVEALFREV
jgi:HAD superfamily hydrolase (TIGR01450 family)